MAQAKGSSIRLLMKTLGLIHVDVDGEELKEGFVLVHQLLENCGAQRGPQCLIGRE